MVKRRLLIVTIILLVIIVLVVVFSQKRKPILVGFAGELTGRHAGMGVDGRDGAQLAVDEINEAGGINGRPIKLIIKDDKGDPVVARRVDAELIEQGVVAIIGHMTSGQSAAVLDLINEAKVVLLAPTSTSSRFSGRVDYFFRVINTSDTYAKALAGHMYNNRGVRKLTGIYDLGNRAFAETLWKTIQADFERMGGDAGQAFTFTSGRTDLQDLITDVAAAEPEAIMLISSPVDTALMAQYLRREGLTSKLFASGWSNTKELLEKGGRAVEGLEANAGYYAQDPRPVFQSFLRRFKKRYHRQALFPATYGYESVLVLAHALEQTGGKAKGLPQALVEVKNIEGAQGPISLDEFGDPLREIYISVIRDGQFEVIEVISMD